MLRGVTHRGGGHRLRARVRLVLREPGRTPWAHTEYPVEVLRRLLDRPATRDVDAHESFQQDPDPLPPLVRDKFLWETSRQRVEDRFVLKASAGARLAMRVRCTSPLEVWVGGERIG